jgi:hypothetical protein
MKRHRHTKLLTAASFIIKRKKIWNNFPLRSLAGVARIRLHITEYYEDVENDLKCLTYCDVMISST